MLVIIDNHDSFVFNIARCFRMLGATVEVVRSDQIDVDALVQLKPRGIVISPGPRTPAEAGISVAVVRALSGHLPSGFVSGTNASGAYLEGRSWRLAVPFTGRPRR
ncbi:anthranilate/para-aminobenzoate synthase component II [Bradyrhizobium sp. AZCC 2289]